MSLGAAHRLEASIEPFRGQTAVLRAALSLWGGAHCGEATPSEGHRTAPPLEEVVRLGEALWLLNLIEGWSPQRTPGDGSVLSQ